MAYVPGFEDDVFLSYSHGDDSAWMQAFQQALAQAVRSRLGHEILLWQDVKRLRAGQDWASEIREGIGKTAAFVAVLSPSYQNSDWCTRELMTFLGPDGLIEQAKVGDLYRFLKVIKIPWENDDHECFFPKLQHVQFFRKIDGPQYHEYPLSSENFNLCVQEAAAYVTTLLRTMRRRLQMVFVASPADDVVDAWTRVRAQLFDDRFNVRPEGRINSGYEDRVLLRDIENAVLTVHLLGPSYDAFAERQLRLAADAGRRLMIWFAKGTENQDQVDPKQWSLLESIRKREGLSGALDWFPGTVQDMIGQIQSALRPKPVAAVSGESGSPRIYLIHDLTTRDDASFASELRARLKEEQKLEVLFPPSGATSAVDFQERHRQQLQTCDGVLLYWNAAPETWFDQYYRDVLIQGRKAKARSKAFLLDDPTQMNNCEVPVIQRRSNFQLSDLNPFLEPLRAGEVNRARAQDCAFRENRSAFSRFASF